MHIRRLPAKIIALFGYIYIVLALSFYGNEAATKYPQILGFILAALGTLALLAFKAEMFIPKGLKFLVLFFFILFLSSVWVGGSLSFLWTNFQVLFLTCLLINIGVYSKFDIFYFGFVTSAVVIFSMKIMNSEGLAIQGSLVNERSGFTVGNANDYALLLVCVVSLIFSRTIKLFQGEGRGLAIFTVGLAVICIMEIIFVTLSKSGLFLLLPVFLVLTQDILRNSNRLVRFPLIFLLFAGLYALSESVLDSSSFERVLRMTDTLSVSKNGDASTTERLALYKEGIRLWSERPLFGWGTNRFRYINTVALDTYSHSNYIELLANHGLVGLILFYSFHFRTLRQLLALPNDVDIHINKIWCLTFLLILFLVDLTFVTYYNKIYMMFLISISVYVEKCAIKRKRLIKWI